MWGLPEKGLLLELSFYRHKRIVKPEFLASTVAFVSSEFYPCAGESYCDGWLLCLSKYFPSSSTYCSGLQVCAAPFFSDLFIYLFDLEDSIVNQ